MIRVPMLFPGQASQQVGMAKDLAAGDGPGAALLAQVNDLLGYDLTHLMYEGPAETLTETRHAQPAILAHSVAVVLELQRRGVAPSVVAGHSLGEFSAAVAAGALTPEDGLRLVARRGELMFAAGRQQPGSMAAVIGLAAPAVVEVCERLSREVGTVCLANHNSATQCAISGQKAAVDAARALLLEAGARKVIPLPVSGAFHSPLLAEAARDFAGELTRHSWHDPDVPLVANVSAQAAITAADLREGLVRQMTSPVRWQESLAAIASGVAGQPAPAVVLEVGPGRVLANLAKRDHAKVQFAPVGTCDELDMVLDILGGQLT